MEIRRLTPLDAGSYLNIRLQALKNNPEAFASSFEEEKERSVENYETKFSSEDSTTLGAFVEDELVGVITLVREKLAKLSHRTTIVAMYVAPGKRGEGIGRALIKESIDRARKWKGIEQVHLTVVTTNKPAKELYSLLGFETYGTEKRALKLGDTYFNEDLMVLFL